jgi:hypothetical protein
MRDGYDLALAQFAQPAGGDADRRGHWSVWRGDPDPNRPHARASFQAHLAHCGLCRELEADSPPAVSV